MVETPECKKIRHLENLDTNIVPLLDSGYDVVVKMRVLDILICPIQKESK